MMEDGAATTMLDSMIARRATRVVSDLVAVRDRVRVNRDAIFVLFYLDLIDN